MSIGLLLPARPYNVPFSSLSNPYKVVEGKPHPNPSPAEKGKKKTMIWRFARE